MGLLTSTTCRTLGTPVEKETPRGGDEGRGQVPPHGRLACNDNDLCQSTAAAVAAAVVQRARRDAARCHVRCHVLRCHLVSTSRQLRARNAPRSTRRASATTPAPICIYIYMCICIHTYIYIYIYTHIIMIRIIMIMIIIIMIMMCIYIYI